MERIFDKNKNGYLAVFDNGMFITHLDCVTKPLSLTGIKILDFIKEEKVEE